MAGTAARHQKPGVGHQRPGTEHHRPGAGHQGPGIGHQRLGVGHHTLTADPGLQPLPAPLCPQVLMHNSSGLPRSPPGSVRGRPPARSSRLPTAAAGPGASPLRAAGERGEPRGCPRPGPGPGRHGRCVPTAGRGRVVRRGQRGARRRPCGAGGQRQLLTGRVYSRRRCHLVSEKD